MESENKLMTGTRSDLSVPIAIVLAGIIIAGAMFLVVIKLMIQPNSQSLHNKPPVLIQSGLFLAMIIYVVILMRILL